MPKDLNYKGKVAPASGSPVVKWIALGAAVVVLIGLIGFASYRSAGPVGPGPNLQVPTAQDTSNNAILAQLAKESHGNFNALSPADQLQVNQITHGHAALVMSILYKSGGK